MVKLGISEGNSENLMDGVDLHIHFPAGAIGKDGPSAGVTITTSLVSLLTRRIVVQGKKDCKMYFFTTF